MPRYNSDLGKWRPAKEKVGLTNEAGEPYIYEGPDRAALEVLKEQGFEEQGYMGEDFRDNADSIEVAAKFKCADPEEYARKRGWNPEKSKETLEANSKVVHGHKAPERKQATKPQGGGVHIQGGFGDMPSKVD